MSRNMVWMLFRPVTWKVIKLFPIGLTVRVWQEHHFDRVAMKLEKLITSVCIVLYAPNFKHFTTCCIVHTAYHDDVLSGIGIEQTPPRDFVRFSWKSLGVLLTPLGSKVIKIIHFGDTVWAWCGRHFECFARKNQMLITSLCIVQDTWNFTCVIRVPPWTHSYADIQPYS